MLKRQGKTQESAKLRDVLKRGRENLCQDQPDDADEYWISLERGDVIVSATDGVFDNLFNHEIHTIIKAYKDEQYQLRTSQPEAQNSAELPCLLSTK